MLYRQTPPYRPAGDRYAAMPYPRAGRSGLRLPAVSLGMWHNFGGVDAYENARAMTLRAFDLGVTYMDLANNYGPPFGSAEETFGRILREDLAGHRDELIVATKAGYDMWPGPYGNEGSRKYLLASLDQSLRRLGVETVDVFYSHRYDPETPLEETMGALAHAVRSGKALYAAISSYPPEATREAVRLLREMGAPCVLHQPKYNLLAREPEDALFRVLADEGVGCAVFSPLAQGVLTDTYLDGVPEGSRAARPEGALGRDAATAHTAAVRQLQTIAQDRRQTVAQVALAWTLRRPEVTTAIIGASRVSQVEEAVAAATGPPLTDAEVARIEAAFG